MNDREMASFLSGNSESKPDSGGKQGSERNTDQFKEVKIEDYLMNQNSD